MFECSLFISLDVEIFLFASITKSREGLSFQAIYDKTPFCDEKHRSCSLYDYIR